MKEGSQEESFYFLKLKDLIKTSIRPPEWFFIRILINPIDTDPKLNNLITVGGNLPLKTVFRTYYTICDHLSIA